MPQAPRSSQGRRAGGEENGSQSDPMPAPQSRDVLEVLGDAAAPSWDGTIDLRLWSH